MLRTSIVLALLGALLPAEATLTHYTVTDLQATYGDNFSFGRMSKDGTLIGSDLDTHRLVSIQRGAFTSQGYFYSAFGGELVRFLGDGTVESTGFTTPGDMFPAGQGRNGQVVGKVNAYPGAYLGSSGIVYDPIRGGSVVEEMGGVYVIEFQRINDANHIAGYGLNKEETAHSGVFLWRDNEPAIQVLLNGDAYATGLNNADQVVGILGGDSFFWDAGNLYRPVRFHVPDPAHPGVTNQAVTEAYAYDVSETGVMTGAATLRSVPGFTTPASHNKGYLWSLTDGLVWLDDLIDYMPTVQLTSGRVLADDGTIFADGFTNGIYHQYLLTPIIPEPSASIFLLTSLGYACLLRRRGRGERGVALRSRG